MKRVIYLSQNVKSIIVFHSKRIKSGTGGFSATKHNWRDSIIHYQCLLQSVSAPKFSTISSHKVEFVKTFRVHIFHCHYWKWVVKVSILQRRNLRSLFLHTYLDFAWIRFWWQLLFFSREIKYEQWKSCNISISKYLSLLVIRVQWEFDKNFVKLRSYVQKKNHQTGASEP